MVFGSVRPRTRQSHALFPDRATERQERRGGKRPCSPAATAAFGVRWLDTALNQRQLDGATCQQPKPNTFTNPRCVKPHQKKAASSRRTPKCLRHRQSTDRPPQQNHLRAPRERLQRIEKAGGLSVRRSASHCATAAASCMDGGSG